MLKLSRHTQSILILVLTNVVWGTTFPLIKGAVGTLPASALIAGRFLVAAIAILPLCRGFNRAVLRDGGLLGIVVFAAYLSQAVGLETTPSNRAAFITSLNVILVPLFGVLLGRRVALRVLAAALLALVGVGVMSWEGGALSWGDLWIFLCAVFWAIYILMMETLAPRHPPLQLTIVQLLAIALLGLVWAAPQLPAALPALQQHWVAIVYLGLMATVVTTWVQVFAQRHVTAPEAAIVYTLEPVFAALFAYWWLQEALGIRGLIGGGIILMATLLSQIGSSPPAVQASGED